LRSAANATPRPDPTELTARGYRALLRGIDVFMLAEAVAGFRASG
jgi:hypothetical protein